MIRDHGPEVGLQITSSLNEEPLFPVGNTILHHKCFLRSSYSFSKRLWSAAAQRHPGQYLVKMDGLRFVQETCLRAPGEEELPKEMLQRPSGGKPPDDKTRTTARLLSQIRVNLQTTATMSDEDHFCF